MCIYLKIPDYVLALYHLRMLLDASLRAKLYFIKSGIIGKN